MADLEKEYGGALADLAKEEGLMDQLLPDVQLTRKVLKENREYVKFLTSPNIAIGERLHAIDEAFAAAHVYVKNFIKMMTERGYAAHLADCLAEYERIYREVNHIALAEVKSAVALSKDQVSRLQASLEKRAGKKVQLVCTVDPSLIGGLRVTMDGELLEGSIRGKLDRIRTELSDTTL